RINKIDNKIEKSQPEYDKNGKKENPSESETSSYIRTDLLDNTQESSKKPIYRNSRNIFWRIPPPGGFKKVHPAPEKKEPPPESEKVIPPINLKVKGFIEKRINSRDAKRTRFAIIILDEKMHVVKKGDLLENQYEIMEVGQDRIEVHDKKFDRIKIFYEQKKP
ncbi:MAG: hypothetical protein JW774_07790, partial [Candidatus Aureabacteria bacterium]|nr:hypothetical protein [Candidatus Auribacterota bacterium]